MPAMDWEQRRREDLVKIRGGDPVRRERMDAVTLSHYDHQLAQREIKRRALVAAIANEHSEGRIRMLAKQLSALDDWLDEFEASSGPSTPP